VGFYLESYWATVGTCVVRCSSRDMLRRREVNGTTSDCLGLTVLSSMILSVLLMTGGIEQNPGPAAEVENTIGLLCAGCSENRKSGIQYELCEKWYH
jgi:hypothetical protein